MRITDGFAIGPPGATDEGMLAILSVPGPGVRLDPDALGRFATEGIPRSLGTLLPAVGSL